ncbi:hypothetical protein GA0074695_0641 [Micromonospora viridifaciens]|uniref:Uncharacterized protein n=1 Tax=Micromonospora viridifaciens TaxID=1881 RepID=A0A1C4UM12_MICVI|nr:hypothetical protein [Micromonospora viridifaciens]SCE72763.1 hypothetical protein GA0074695_0641 [Micromonospora viridifaciens]
MELISSDGAQLELRLEGYQLDAPDTPVPADEEEDRDEWLVIRGRVRVADGPEWSFVQPCLTTEEAERLAVWLATVGAGETGLWPASPPYQALICFTEPNLAFSLERADADRARVRVHLSHESLPPWQPSHDWPDYHAYFVTLDVSTADLRTAAERWRIEHEPFPRRLPPGHLAGDSHG